MLKKWKQFDINMWKLRVIRTLCCMAEARLLHSGGSYCMAEALIASMRLGLPSKFERLVSALRRLMVSGGSLPHQTKLLRALFRIGNFHLFMEGHLKLRLQSLLQNYYLEIVLNQIEVFTCWYFNCFYLKSILSYTHEE